MLAKGITIFLLLQQWIETSSALQQRHNLYKRQSNPTDYDGYLVPSYNISIPVDHFNESDTRTYNNRYWVNDTYYQPGGPIFFYDQGELGVSEQDATQILAQINKTSATMLLAERYNGTAVLWEHRYYGLSNPIPVNKITEEPEGELAGYQYLTVDQALEDVVYFANNWQPDGCSGDECEIYRPSRTPWIWVGGSYPGIRGAFMRIRNPEIIYATWASSAPVQAMYAGTPYFTPMQQSLPPNCSADVQAAVELADEIMDGQYGNDTFYSLQKLTDASAATERGLNDTFDFSYSWRYSTYSIASIMVSPLLVDYQSAGPTNTTQLFCTYLESYNPGGPASNTSNVEIAILSNAGDGNITDIGLAATYNSTVALEAYFYASRRWWQFFWDTLYDIGVPQELPPDFFADQLAWDYQVQTQFGWFQGSDPDNVTIVSKYYNVTAVQESAAGIFYSDSGSITPADFPPGSPDTDAFNEYGGWNMTPSNVMFTDGELDPWRGGTVMSNQPWIGAPNRTLTTSVPTCGMSPDGTDVFGLVYPGAVHVPDQLQWEWEPYNESSPVYQGVELFSKALDVWLPCFNRSTSSA